MAADPSSDELRNTDAPELRWVWNLANGGSVTAIIDPEANTESVLQNGKALSSSPRGGKPDGHAVLISPRDRPKEKGEEEEDQEPSLRPPIEAVVTFGVGTAVCVLRVDGEEVAPSLWPMRKKREPVVLERQVTIHRPSSRTTFLVIFVSVATLIGAGFIVKALRKDPAAIARKEGHLPGTYRALNGLYIVHYSEDLEPKLAVMPAQVGAVIFDDKQRTMSILVGAINLAEGAVGAPAARDPWSLQQLYREEALANLPKGSGRYEETGRHDDLCFSKPGAIVTGQILAKNGTRTARTWSCTFAHDNAGYIMLYMLAEPISETDEKHVRTILEATELTHLSDLGSIPPGMIPNPTTPAGSAAGADPLGNIPQIGSGSLPKLDLK